MKINNSFCKLLLLTSLLLFQSFNLYAQWSTQTVELKLGWNGVYLHVDASHENISELEDLDPNITDIWLWNPKLKSDQFIQNPMKVLNQLRLHDLMMVILLAGLMTVEIYLIWWVLMHLEQKLIWLILLVRLTHKLV